MVVVAVVAVVRVMILVSDDIELLLGSYLGDGRHDGCTTRS